MDNFRRARSHRSDTDAACIRQRLDQAGIAGAVLYPSTVLRAYACLSDKALSALLRRYNDWILELCAGAPERLRHAVLLNVDEPETTAAEVRRTTAAGAAAAVVRGPAGAIGPAKMELRT